MTKKNLIFVSCLIFLTGCATKYVDEKFKFDAQNKNGLVAVAGVFFKIDDTNNYNFYRLDYQKHKILDYTLGCGDCSPGGQYKLKAETNHMVVATLEPGIYAFGGYTTVAKHSRRTFTTFKKYCKNSPVFRVKPGQMTILNLKPEYPVDLNSIEKNVKRISQIIAPIKEAEILSVIRYDCNSAVDENFTIIKRKGEL